MDTVDKNTIVALIKRDVRVKEAINLDEDISHMRKIENGKTISLRKIC